MGQILFKKNEKSCKTWGQFDVLLHIVYHIFSFIYLKDFYKTKAYNFKFSCNSVCKKKSIKYKFARKNNVTSDRKLFRINCVLFILTFIIICFTFIFYWIWFFRPQKYKTKYFNEFNEIKKKQL